MMKIQDIKLIESADFDKCLMEAVDKMQDKGYEVEIQFKPVVYEKDLFPFALVIGRGEKRIKDKFNINNKFFKCLPKEKQERIIQKMKR